MYTDKVSVQKEKMIILPYDNYVVKIQKYHHFLKFIVSNSIKVWSFTDIEGYFFSLYEVKNGLKGFKIS